MKSTLKIGFITTADPYNKKALSGTPYRMYEALKTEFKEVIPLGPLHLPKWTAKIVFLIYKLNKFITSKSYNVTHNILSSKVFARLIEAKLKKQPVDIIIAPFASTQIGYLKTNIPIVYISDTSFQQISGEYNFVSDLSKFSQRESNLIEQKALSNSFQLLYSSQWAADFVINYYRVSTKKVKVVKFGANIDEAPDLGQIERRFDNTINLLFLGVEWQRKGGDIAFEAFKTLRQKGHNIKFYVCGCVPPVEHQDMIVVGFLNKNISADLLKFKDLLLQTHLLILPTRADCTPMVFAEVNAYGIPAITTDVGGVRSLVDDGINGFILPLQSEGIDYAFKIEELLKNRSIFLDFSKRAREKYDNELNWSNWSTKVKNLITSTLGM